MSAGHIFPTGDDRSWTREFYYAINRVTRYMWWANHSDEKLAQAAKDVFLYGRGMFRVDSSPERDWSDSHD